MPAVEVMDTNPIGNGTSNLVDLATDIIADAAGDIV